MSQDDTIVWSGSVNGTYMYRLLGTSSMSNNDGIIDTANIDDMSATMDRPLAHCEGTSHRDATSPVIGSGQVFHDRNLALHGYAVGTNISDRLKPPPVIDTSTVHCMVYDIEAEYAGDAVCNLGSPILCVSLKCSCGEYSRLISRHPVNIDGMQCQVVNDNASMARAVIWSMIRHKPTFTYGHNVYLFDNIVLALALPKDDRMRDLFTPTTDTLGAASSQAGFIISIPGINNIDTYRYIRQSMSMRFQRFSLEHLAINLGLSNQKSDTQHLQFNLTWYIGSDHNAESMVRYNVADCDTNRSLLDALSVIPQMCTICYSASAAMHDVSLYRTGAMASSALSHSAMTRQLAYIWTRCDWIPGTFVGGEVLFPGPGISNNVSICDFVSMYPSVIASCGISPECVDFVNHGELYTHTFQRLEVCWCECDVGYAVYYSCVLYGLRPFYIHSTTSTTMYTPVPIAWYSDSIDNRDTAQVLDLVHAWVTSRLLLDPRCGTSMYDIRQISIGSTDMHTCAWSHATYHARQLCTRSIECNRTESYHWLPDHIESFSGHKVDWHQSMLGSMLVFTTPDTTVRFYPTFNIAGNTCLDLIKNRQNVKQKMRALQTAGGGSRTAEVRAMDHLQYSLKIISNSLYGCMAFRAYNTYSPRCGMATTGCGRWSLNVASTIASRIGFKVVYGDTDSIMYSLDSTAPFSDVIFTGLSHMTQCLSRMEPMRRNRTCMDYMSRPGSSTTTHTLLCSRHNTWLQGLVPRIINHVLSYTIMSQLTIEHQYTDTPSELQHSMKCGVYDTMCVITPKVYVAKCGQRDIMTKGISYVRRSGSNLRSLCDKVFINILINNNSADARYGLLYDSYHKIMSAIGDKSRPGIFVLSRTVSGKTTEVFKLRNGICPVQSVQFSDVKESLDVPYYMRILHTSLEMACRPLGHTDIMFVINYRHRDIQLRDRAIRHSHLHGTY